MIIGQESPEPDWKRLWDSARSYTRNQEYDKAIPLYKEVLEQKPQIEEVKWELCRVLIEKKNYPEASLLLESLLESNTNRIEYLLSAGHIALLTQKENQAVLYFGQALEQDPGGKFYKQALSGLINALVSQNKGELAVPLMEQLYQSGGSSPDLLLILAQSLRQIGELKKAGYYYQELINKYRISPEVIRQASAVFEQLEDKVTTAALWERYLTEAPDSLFIRKKLTDYYLANNKSGEALRHLIILLDHNINREEYLLEAGRINMSLLGRPDKALGYFENYINEFPDGENISTEIENIRLILANNLLSIVENDGVWLLWTDLAKTTPDRIGIYRAMAELLEAVGKKKELIEVLQIINIHQPEDIEIRLRLSLLYFTSKMYQRCLDTLSFISINTGLPKEYYQLKIQCVQAMKSDRALMISYLGFLDVFSEDDAVRIKAIGLAGMIGDVKAIRRLLAGYISQGIQKSPTELAILNAGVESLIVNQLFSHADSIIFNVLEDKDLNQGEYIRFSRLSARIQQLQDSKFGAEQQLRMSMVKDHGSLEIIFDLAGNAIENSETAPASVLLSIAKNELSKNNQYINHKEYLSQLLYNELKLHQNSEQSRAMRKKGTAYIKSYDQSRKPNIYDKKIFMLLVADLYRDSDYNTYKNLISDYAYFLPNKEFTGALLLLVDSSKNGKTKYFWNYISKQYSSSELFEIVEILTLFGEFDLALLLAEHLEKQLTDSVRLEVLRVQLYLKQNNYEKAANIYRELLKSFPDEKYFYEQIDKFDTYGSKRVVTTLSPDEQDVIVKETDESTASRTGDPDQQLQKARGLWIKDRETESLMAYDDLESSLRKRLQIVLEDIKNNLEYRSISNESFWNNLSTSEHDLEILDQVMDISFFLSHLDDAVSGKTAESYENYRWLKLVAKEHKAKQALNKKEFYQAEKRYQELLKEEVAQSVNVYSDLATVYNRLGKYTKETELLEKIKEQQIHYPALQIVAEKNKNRRRPQLFADGLWREEDGRSGEIDIKQQYLGLGLRIQPTAYQEAGFQAGRNIYGNSLDNSILTSNALNAQYALLFGEDIELSTKLGFEDIKEEGNAYVYYNITLSGSLAESVHGHASVDQKLVSDTIKSLSEGIYLRDYQAGLTIDYLPRIFFGFDFTSREYSDENYGKKFNLWSSYRIFSDLTNFDITYDYEKLENKIDSDKKEVDNGGLPQFDLGYWSPGNYWKHSLTAKFKRELWPIGKRQSGTSYIAAHYGLGYESGENFIQQAKLDILLEISTPFLLKGTFVADWSEDYNRTQAYAVLVYRW